MLHIGPYSSAIALAKLDGRTRAGRLMREVRKNLAAHVGGAPSAAQGALIDRAAWLQLHLALMDAKVGSSEGMSERDARQYLAWSNSFTRTLKTLGLDEKKTPAEPLADWWARQRQGDAA